MPSRFPSADARGGEVVASWPVAPGRPVPVAHVKSTIVSSGLTAFHARGLMTRYLALLPHEHHAGIESLIAGTWLPIEFAIAHYEACERLQLSYEETLDIGLAVGARMHESLLVTVKKLASAAGVTPWTAFAQYARLWQRSFDGGAFSITRTGPKDALLQISQLPLARFAYFRGSYCGVTLAGIRLFSRLAYIRMLPATSPDHSFSFRASWV